jgi:hypothetical protein
MASEPLSYEEYGKGSSGKVLEGEPCVICGRRSEGFVRPLYAMRGTPDHCRKCFNERKALFALELLVLGEP